MISFWHDHWIFSVKLLEPFLLNVLCDPEPVTELQVLKTHLVMAMLHSAPSNLRLKLLLLHSLKWQQVLFICRVKFYVWKLVSLIGILLRHWVIKIGCVLGNEIRMMFLFWAENVKLTFWWLFRTLYWLLKFECFQVWESKSDGKYNDNAQVFLCSGYDSSERWK